MRNNELGGLNLPRLEIYVFAQILCGPRLTQLNDFDERLPETDPIANSPVFG